MSATRFRWTRSRYERARRLSRLLSRFESLPEQPPGLDRYFELMRPVWEASDPLLVPVQTRLDWRHGIPF